MFLEVREEIFEKMKVALHYLKIHYKFVYSPVQSRAELKVIINGVFLHPTYVRLHGVLEFVIIINTY